MIRLLAAGATDVGLWRTNNEDAYLVMPEAGLLALSDGMHKDRWGQTPSILLFQPADGGRRQFLRSAPSGAVSASLKSPVDIPFRYNHGNSSPIVFVRRKYGGSIADLNLISLPRSLTCGALISIAPSPVWSALRQVAVAHQTLPPSFILLRPMSQ